MAPGVITGGFFLLSFPLFFPILPLKFSKCVVKHTVLTLNTPKCVAQHHNSFVFM